MQDYMLSLEERGQAGLQPQAQTTGQSWQDGEPLRRGLTVPAVVLRRQRSGAVPGLITSPHVPAREFLHRTWRIFTLNASDHRRAHGGTDGAGVETLSKETLVVTVCGVE